MAIKRKKVSKIGGQAVLEGVMMRGERSMATCVRTSDGNLQVESKRLNPTKKWWQKTPIIRGVCNFFVSMVDGMKIMMRSADVWGEDMLQEEQETKSEIWMKKHLHIDLMTLSMIIGVILGVALAVGLFIVLPQVLGGLMEKIDGYRNMHYILRNLFTNLYKTIVFILYLAIIGCQKNIKRVFQYHGAEHKVITCYEQDLELTVENARNMTRRHDRCGTSFLVIVIVVSIIATIFIPTFDNVSNSFLRVLYRIGSRIILLPFIAGFSYEVLKFLAKYDNAFIRFLKAPGLAVQWITTKEPDDSMLEVSLKAFKTVMELDADEQMETTTFVIMKNMANVKDSLLKILSGIEEKEAECDWIMCKVLGCNRSELPLIEKVQDVNVEAMQKYALERVRKGRPLQYVLGDTNFYGVILKTDERALIPRLDTECVVEKAISIINERGYQSVLDLCTGSGAIAIAIAKNTSAKVTASDISRDAISLAMENAKTNDVDITFVESDMFENIPGRFDLIISNPPYIPTKDIKGLAKELSFEPISALDGGADGLDYYRIIAKEYGNHLTEGGALVLEIGDSATATLFDGAVLDKDLSDNIRILTV